LPADTRQGRWQDDILNTMRGAAVEEEEKNKQIDEKEIQRKYRKRRPSFQAAEEKAKIIKAKFVVKEGMKMLMPWQGQEDNKLQVTEFISVSETG
jgi:hypothetical protein